MEKEEILLDPLANLDSEQEDQTPETEAKAEEVTENSETDDKEEEEEKKELSAKEKRHAEQQEWSRKEVERLRSLVIEAEVSKASADAQSLLDLAQKDTKLADEVARKFGYKDFRDAKTQITAWQEVEDKKPTWMSKEDLEERYQERKAKDEHESSLQEAKALLEKLPEELQDEAIEEFNELIEGKTLTRAKAMKIANMVTLSLKKETKKTDVTEGLKKLSTTGISNSKKPSKDEMVEVLIDGKIVLLDSKQLS